MINERYVAYVDGVFYVSQPVVHVKARVTIECRRWLLDKGTVIHVLH